MYFGVMPFQRHVRDVKAEDSEKEALDSFTEWSRKQTALQQDRLDRRAKAERFKLATQRRKSSAWRATPLRLLRTGPVLIFTL